MIPHLKFHVHIKEAPLSLKTYLKRSMIELLPFLKQFLGANYQDFQKRYINFNGSKMARF